MKTSYFLKQLFGAILFFSILFLSAGRLNYWQGWAYTVIGLFMFSLNYTLLKLDPELLKERSKPGQGAKKWDQIILGLSFLATLTMYITAGLDSGRYHWSPDFQYGLYGTGMILTVSGQLFFLVAQKQNKFFSSTVRIQQERGHTVCDAGPYQMVRHPAYLGQVIQTLGFPLLMGSYWSIIPAGSLIILSVIRTYKEDQTLMDELNGYADYSRKTRYRLIPLIW